MKFVGDYVKHIYLKAMVKVNLTLEVLNKREDSYRNLKSVFLKVNLYDEIDLFKIESGLGADVVVGSLFTEEGGRNYSFFESEPIVLL